MENPEIALQAALRGARTLCRQCGGASTRLSPTGRISKICSDACELQRGRECGAKSARKAGRLRSEPLPLRACASCGASFSPKQGNHLTCSNECQRTHKIALVRVKVGYVGPQDRDCARCGATFLTKQPSQVYCTKLCTALAWRAANPEAFAASTEGSRKRSLAKAAEGRAARPPRPCTVCAQPFAGPAGRSICSRECDLQQGRDRARSHYEARRLSLVETFSAECVECTLPFTYQSQSGPLDRKFCSAACTERPGKRKRNARLRRKAPGIDHVDKAVSYGWVRKRDGWKCQCCGIPTSRGAVGTPDAPELDHIVPLARGGFHQAGNLWLLCRTCNLAKSDRDPIEFLVSHFAGHPDQLVAAFARLGRAFSHMEV